MSTGSRTLADGHPIYQRPGKIRRWGAVLLGASAALGVACGGGSDDGASAAEWMETDGANGRINMDDVKQAYEDAFSNGKVDVGAFEKRVNEIYEGDHIVMVKAEKTAEDRLEISGWEDLDDTKSVEDGKDDKLFTISQRLVENGQYQVQGNHANGYYSGGGFLTGFLPGLLIGQMFAGGRTSYITPPGFYDNYSSYRGSYRGGPAYVSQQARNTSYGSSVPSRFGSSATSQPVSPARSSYQSRQTSSGGFRSSSSSSRSISSGGSKGPTSGSSSSRGSGGKSSGGKSGGGSSSGGGVSGGGGAMRL